MPEIKVAKVEASVTFPLRRRVLGSRLGELHLEDMARPDDTHPDSGHFAVFHEALVVGTGTVRRRSAPWLLNHAGFQIRGMAVEPTLRKKGIGSAILAAIVHHVEGRGGGLLWCHARLSARSLYSRAGFSIHGHPTHDLASGEQIAMFRFIYSGNERSNL